VKPMQRLTRYSLLLKAILRKTDLDPEILALKRMVSHLKCLYSFNGSSEPFQWSYFGFSCLILLPLKSVDVFERTKQTAADAFHPNVFSWTAMGVYLCSSRDSMLYGISLNRNMFSLPLKSIIIV